MCIVKVSCNSNIVPFLYAYASELNAAAWHVLQLDRNFMVLQDSEINTLDLMLCMYTYSKHGKPTIA